MGSLDLSKFLDKNKEINYEQLETAVRLGVQFLDSVIDVSSFPTIDIENWAKENRAIGLGIMGLADYFLQRKIAYGSEQSIKELYEIGSFIKRISEEESIRLGEQLGIPEMCKKLPIPRRNITINTVAPTGTVSIIAGCSSGIEPIFSEVTIRNDKTGTYTFENDLADKDYFRCAVSSDGQKEVTWEEHIKVLATTQKFIDSGVSKTINFPTHTHKETMSKAAIMAWKEGCKGIAMYRNGSRKVEVLTPKNVQRDKCPVCGSDMMEVNGKQKCTKCIDKTTESSTYYD